MASRNDAGLWADISTELAKAGMGADERMLLARTIVALVRRDRSTTKARTFAPGDEIPLDVTRAYDLDGHLWERQSSDPESWLKDSWKMPGFDPDKHEPSCEGVWITPWLLEQYGPLTEIRPHGKMRLG